MSHKCVQGFAVFYFNVGKYITKLQTVAIKVDNASVWLIYPHSSGQLLDVFSASEVS